LKGAEETVKMIEKIKGKAIAVQADVTDSEKVHVSAEEARAKFGPVTILVNNAGI
jgi:2-hydroxycyclohexanecarboxyl-CoA dehydrogenase